MPHARDMYNYLVARSGHDPDTDDFRDEVYEFLSSEQGHLFSEAGFRFAQRETTVVHNADVTSSTGTVTQNSPIVTSTANDFASWMEGQTFIGPDGVRHTIKDVLSATQVYLEDNYTGATAAFTAAFTVKHTALHLPAGVESVLDVGDYVTDQNGKFTSWATYDVSARNLDRIQEGDPARWYPLDDVYVMAPVQALEAPAVSGAGGAFLVGEHKFKMTYSKLGGLHSAPSLAVSATTTATTQEFAFTSLPNLPVGEGYKKNLWVKPPGFKAYYLLAADIPHSTTSATYTSYGAGGADGLRFLQRLPENEGVYKRIALHPIPTTLLDVIVRHKYRPNRLIEDTDAPEFPAPFHMYLVYKALGEVYIKGDDRKSKAKVYMDKAEDLLRRMKQGSLDDKARDWVKGSWDRDLVQGRDIEWGPVTYA